NGGDDALVGERVVRAVENVDARAIAQAAQNDAGAALRIHDADRDVATAAGRVALTDHPDRIRARRDDTAGLIDRRRKRGTLAARRAGVDEWADLPRLTAAQA